MNERDAATQELVEEGLRSYVRVLAAIRSFKVEVVRQCRAVLEEGLPNLSRSLGVTAREAAISEEIDPANIEEFGQDWAWIAVTIELIREKLWFSVGVYIDEISEGPARFQAHAGFYTARRDASKALFHSLGDQRGKAFVFDEPENFVSAAEPIAENALSSYQVSLRTAMQRWMDPAAGKSLSAVVNALHQ